jgi:hypothetical protein
MVLVRLFVGWQAPTITVKEKSPVCGRKHLSSLDPHLHDVRINKPPGRHNRIRINEKDVHVLPQQAAMVVLLAVVVVFFIKKD